MEEFLSFSFLIVLFLVFFGLAFGFGNKLSRTLYLSLFIFVGLMDVIMGARGGFGITLLVLIWIYSFYHKINWIKLSSILLVALFLLLYIFSLSIRQNDISDSPTSLIDSLINFISGQGISLMVFEASRQIPDYPIVSYFQSIIPGSNAMYQFFSGETLQGYESGFSNWMCYHLNSVEYEQGFGLGWSVLSDFYLFGFRTYFGFSLVALFFGWLIAKLELDASKSGFALALLFSLMNGLLFLPRGPFSSFFTVIVYCLIVYFMITVFIQVLQRNQHKLHRDL